MEPVYMVLGQAAGDFVQQNHPGAGRHGAGQFHQALLAAWQAAQPAGSAEGCAGVHG